MGKAGQTPVLGTPGPDATKRPVCPACQRPERACICQWVTPVAHATEVLILQHPLEVGHVKNSAGLLQRSLAHSRVVIGETFDAAALRAAMGEPKYTVLLYPQTALSPSPIPDATRLQDTANLRLVVLDGTWRKSRKMLHLSPPLQSLPRLSLDDMPASSYLIRKAHRPGQLSTLEATCAALAQLEGGLQRFQPLLEAFDGFVAQQLAFRPQ